MLIATSVGSLCIQSDQEHSEDFQAESSQETWLVYRRNDVNGLEVV